MLSPAPSSREPSPVITGPALSPCLLSPSGERKQNRRLADPAKAEGGEVPDFAREGECFPSVVITGPCRPTSAQREWRAGTRPGDPRLPCVAAKPWMAGTSPAMTSELD